MAKYLMILKNGTDVTAGKVYEVISELSYAYSIRDDRNDWHEWAKPGEGIDFTTNLYEIIEAKRTQLATLTAEIAELEAQIAEESRLKVGDYARVTDTASVDEFALDDVVRISGFIETEFPLRGKCPVSGLYEGFRPASLTKITPAEARASLIAKIDAHFGGQEAK